MGKIENGNKKFKIGKKFNIQKIWTIENAKIGKIGKMKKKKKMEKLKLGKLNKFGNSKHNITLLGMTKTRKTNIYFTKKKFDFAFLFFLQGYFSSRLGQF